jgi:hypothetical protein
VFKVCIKRSQEICGGVRGKVFFGLTAIGFIKLSRMARGNINKIRRHNRIERKHVENIANAQHRIANRQAERFRLNFSAKNPAHHLYAAR